MRFTTSSTSFTIALSAHQAFERISSRSVVASVDVSYALLNEATLSAAHEECTLSTAFQLGGEAPDAGVLSCSDPEYACVEDARSSLGGLCVPVDSVHRDLQACKCTPASACYGLEQGFIDTIPEDSCCGDYACSNVSGTTVIGAGSCVGSYSCYGASGATIGEGSCLGNMACYYIVDATIGDESCTGELLPGANLYYGYSCPYLTGVVGNNSCYEYSACYSRGCDQGIFNVGGDSCRGQGSCLYLDAIEVGTGSCVGYYACYANIGNIVIGSNSCTERLACEFNAKSVSDNQCNLEGECRGPVISLECTDAPSEAPTPKPSSAPTKAPTPKPSSAPTKAPTPKPSSAPTKAPVTPAPTELEDEAESTPSPSGIEDTPPVPVPPSPTPPVPVPPSPTAKSSKQTKSAKDTTRDITAAPIGGKSTKAAKSSKRV